MSQQEHQSRDAGLERAVRALDGFAGAEGRALEDPVLREAIRQQLAGEITGAEARRRIAEHAARPEEQRGPQ